MTAIGVVIPVFNGADYLAEAIESALAQTFPPAEVIVVDDGSEDATPCVAQRFGPAVRYVRIEHGGISCARNAGVELMASEFLAFLDADDIWDRRKLEWQWNALDGGRRRNAMVFGHVERFISPDMTSAERDRIVFDPTPVPAISASALLVPTADFRAVGMFDTGLQTAEFIDWFDRARQHGLAVHMLDEILFRRRLHGNNHGRRNVQSRSDYARALKAAIDRRRRASP